LNFFQKFLLSLIITVFAGADKTIFAAAKPAKNTPSQNTLRRAKEEFAGTRYDKAILYYRKYLRSKPKDYIAWDQLAASYYHTGLPKKALRYLKNNASRTAAKSYNFYYQGLCYLAIDEPVLAKNYFTKSAQFIDEYGSRATFEVATMEYNLRNKNNATYWLKLYRDRYPNGIYTRLAEKMERSLAEGTYLDGIEASKKPDLEAALFKFDGRSLSSYPHYWFFQLGFDYVTGVYADPAPEEERGIRNEEYGSQDLLLNTGIGVGPVRVKDTVSWIGYNYKQKWITNKDRLDTYVSDPGDFAYFPFRPDLLQRSHQFYGDYRKTLPFNFFVGLFGQQDFTRIGSQLFPGPDDVESENRNLSVSRTSLLIPQIGLNYLGNYQTLFYLYLRKELDEEAPEFSNRTYNIFGGGQPEMSYGISHRMGFPRANLDVNFELFKYEFIYNDNWLDYSRLGFLTGAEFEFISNVKLNGLFGYYEDLYQISPLKQNSCGFTKGSSGDGAAKEPKRCPREDTGTILQIGMYWNYSQFDRISAKYTLVDNSNVDEEVFNKSESTYLIMLTMAFPSSDRVLRFIERFGDVAFTKDQE
jgi:Tfp pilus assembly protein PilF